MFSMGRMPSAGSVFSSYTAFAAAVMVVRSVLQELQSLIRQYIPPPIREKIFNFFANLINLSSDPQNTMTLTIQRFAGVSLNELFAGAETYLGTIITPSNTNLIASKTPREAHISLCINRSGDTIVDHFDGVNLVWSLTAAAAGNGRPSSSYSYPEDDCLDGGGGGRSRPRPTTSTSTSLEKRAIELKFDKRFKDKVVAFYLPHVMERARAIIAARKRVRLFSLGSFGDMGPGGRGMWSSVDFDHPSTFETVAMEEEMKKMVVDDLDMFVKRKDFYKRIGKAWKRGYLLYGPPGTGKSSLIAAMANHLRFDVYDLQLKSMESLGCDWDLRRLLVSVPNKSILVIEDVDCSTTTIALENRAINDPKPVNTKIKRKRQFTLSELLNFTDGLWSSCGDERIIVFTTNNKDKLDPALLRPGRMDMHIHMSYLRPGGFKTLAFNYLMIKDHRLFGEIEEMLMEVDATPAEAAENLLRSDDADVALEGLVEFLRNKKKEMSIKSVEVVSTCTDHVDEQNNGCDGNKQDMEDEDSSEDDQYEE